MRHVHNQIVCSTTRFKHVQNEEGWKNGKRGVKLSQEATFVNLVKYHLRSRFAHEREWQLPISFPQLKWSLGTTGQQDILKLTFLFVLGRVAWMQVDVFGIKSRYIAWWHLGTIEPERMSSLTRFAIFLNCKDAEKHGFLPDNYYTTLNSKM